ncbi:hypothetical protein PHLGIDRAFT_77125, partial [Phlebiopsis gigantea 11061_1 CR5-6]
GYVAGLVLDALMRSQLGTPHEDPLQLTAYFLKFLEQGPFEVHVRALRRGSAFTNLSATLVQKAEQKVTTLAIFGVLTPSSRDERNVTVAPPSRFAAPFPLYTHPSQCAKVTETPRWDFLPLLQITRDPHYAKIFAKQGPSMQLGHYFTLKNPADRVTTQSLPFFLDNYMSFAHVTLLRNKIDPYKSRPATLAFSVEFKFPIPKQDSPHHSLRSVAVLNKGQFVNDPCARHETYLEVWTAPTDVGDRNAGTEDWKHHQRCLAICHQTSMIIPLATKKVKRSGPKL